MEENQGIKGTVLVVDDDSDMVKVIGLILTVEGFKVFKAYSGVEGLVMAKREHPDVVLLDIMMPDIDGFEVCRKLKLDPDTKDISIIFVSAKTGQEHIEAGLSLGAQGYITKPFQPSMLIQKIKDAMGKSD